MKNSSESFIYYVVKWRFFKQWIPRKLGMVVLPPFGPDSWILVMKVRILQGWAITYGGQKTGIFFQSFFFSSCSSKKVCCISYEYFTYCYTILISNVHFQKSSEDLGQSFRQADPHRVWTEDLSVLKHQFLSVLGVLGQFCGQCVQSAGTTSGPIYTPSGQTRQGLYSAGPRRFVIFFSFKTWLLQPFSCYTTGQQQVWHSYVYF